ncbi:MAG: hypothetical protein ABI380_15045 [Edaphobacter sp.]
MTFEFDRYNWIRSWDSFGTETSAFERDVHMLILTGLDAGLKLLTTDAQAEGNKLMQASLRVPYIQCIVRPKVEFDLYSKRIGNFVVVVYIFT